MLINEHLAQIAKLDLEHRNTVLERDNEKFAFCDEIGISVESKTGDWEPADHDAFVKIVKK
eukprot:gene46562-58055_t